MASGGQKKDSRGGRLLYTDDETFEFGVDTRTRVNDADYRVPFRFTCKLDKVMVKPGPLQLPPEGKMKGIEARSRTEK